MKLAAIRSALPPRTLLTLAVGAAVALGFLAVFLLPEYHEIKELTVRTANLRQALDERAQLEPVAKALASAQSKVRDVSRVGGRDKLPLADVERLTMIFDELAQPHGVRLSVVAPDAASVTREGLLAVRLAFLGTPEGARRFMLDLGGFGPLVKVESAATMFGREGREFTLKCWLAVR